MSRGTQASTQTAFKSRSTMTDPGADFADSPILQHCQKQSYQQQAMELKAMDRRACDKLVKNELIVGKLNHLAELSANSSS